MSKETVQQAFSQGKAFIPFVTCGDPDIETTKTIVRALAAAGASVIELGIPFSDPTAEGPVIQEANIRSLAAGTTTDTVFQMVRELRDGSPEEGVEPVSCPLVFMTYANVVFHYGVEKFCMNAQAAGVDGLILPDTSFEEKAEFADVCAQYELAYISLIAPTSEERIQMIAREAEGFIYLVSSLGVTGVRSEITTDLASIVAKIREVSSVPIAIGFGISDAQAAAAMAKLSDGAIVGSALVKLVAKHGSNAASVVGELAAEMVSALKF